MAKIRVKPFPKSFADVGRLFAELVQELKNLDFADNLNSRQIELTLNTAGEMTARNPFRTAIPTRFFVVSSTGACLLRKGTTAWTLDQLTFVNHHGSSGGTATVELFL